MSYSVYHSHFHCEVQTLEQARKEAIKCAQTFGWADIVQKVESYKRVTEVKVVKSDD